MSWQRSIDIERYQTVEESDWYLPSGARLQYSQKEFSHYEQVLDHYETKTKKVAHERILGYEDYVSGYRDLGNGYFEEIVSSRPVYETYYEDETYQEPVYRDEPVYRTKYYDEKVSIRSEKYYITGLNKKNKSSNILLSFEDWNSVEVGQTVKLKVSLGYGEIVE